MILFLLFILVCNFTKSQEQIKWINLGASSEIHQKYDFYGENKFLLLSSNNNENYFQVYDYENNEIISSVKAHPIASISLNYQNDIIITKLEDNSIYKYDEDGTILQEYNTTYLLNNIYEYEDNKCFAIASIDNELNFVKYDLLNDEIIEVIEGFTFRSNSKYFRIDDKLMMNGSDEELGNSVYVYDLTKDEIISKTNHIRFIPKNITYFDETIVTFNHERDPAQLYQKITFWDRNTMDTIKTYKIQTDDDYFEYLLEDESIVLRTTENNTIEMYNFENDIIMLEVDDEFNYLNCYKLNDNRYYGYNQWNHFNFSIYEYSSEKMDFSNVSGKQYAIKTENHNDYVTCTKIIENRIYTGSFDGNLNEWDFEGNYISTPFSTYSLITNIDYSSKYNLIGITTVSPSNKIQIFDYTTWELKFEKEYDGFINSIRFNDEDEMFVVTGQRMPNEIFNSNDFTLLNSIGGDMQVTPSYLNKFSAIAIDGKNMVSTYRNGVRLFDISSGELLKEVQLYQQQGNVPVMYLEYDKQKDELIVTGNYEDVFILDKELNIKKTISTEFTDINGKTYSGLMKYKASYLNDSLMYILGRQHLVVYDLVEEKIVFDYNQMDTGGFPNSIRYFDFDFNDEIIVAVNSFGDVYGLVPYDVSSSVEKRIEKNLVYPNPVNNSFIIDLDYYVQLIIFDINGVIVKQINSKSEEINVSDLPTGVYYIRIKQGDDFRFSKFIKN